MTGLGNIYVDEALWQAQIHPEQPADSLKPAEVATLYQAIIDVLARAVEAGGTTIRTYLNALEKRDFSNSVECLWANRLTLQSLWYANC